MAKGTQVQYIRLYTDGSAAKQIIETPLIRKPQVQKKRKPKKIVLYIDPVALLGILTAVSMLVLMTVGVCRLYGARQECHALEAYVQELSEENTRLESAYAESYDLSEIEKTALAIGMVPKNQVQSQTILLSVPEQAEAPATVWNRIGAFLAGLFA